LAAVEVQQSRLFMHGQTSRVGDARIITERAPRRAIAIEGKQRPIPIAIDTECACNKEASKSGVLTHV
jgi:hypothetical protein